MTKEQCFKREKDSIARFDKAINWIVEKSPYSSDGSKLEPLEISKESAEYFINRINKSILMQTNKALDNIITTLDDLAKAKNEEMYLLLHPSAFSKSLHRITPIHPEGEPEKASYLLDNRIRVFISPFMKHDGFLGLSKSEYEKLKEEIDKEFEDVMNRNS